MPEPPRRNATLADVMLAVAGSGLAFFAWRGFLSMPAWQGLPDSPQRYYFQALGLVTLLMPASLILLVMALRRPRPRLGRVSREPAAIVGLSASFVLVVNTALLLAVMGLAGSPASAFTGGKVFYFCRLLAEQTGMTVGSAWFIRAVGGRCRRPRGWMDLAGWVLGACWVLLAIASASFTFM